jgi:hypothetical protein
MWNDDLWMIIKSELRGTIGEAVTMYTNSCGCAKGNYNSQNVIQHSWLWYCRDFLWRPRCCTKVPHYSQSFWSLSQYIYLINKFSGRLAWLIGQLILRRSSCWMTDVTVTKFITHMRVEVVDWKVKVFWCNLFSINLESTDQKPNWCSKC